MRAEEPAQSVGTRSLADLHVHSEWSWDAPLGSMQATCSRAVELGLPAVAFTEHADFTERVTSRGGRLDTAAYREGLERCRQKFPDLRILSGVELGEPHRFVTDAAEILHSGPFDLVLGSVHCVEVGGVLTDASASGLLTAATARALLRSYLRETLALVDSSVAFEVLAHLDYPKRYWPHEEIGYDERDEEELFRAILKTAARRGLVLEVNTTRGMDPGRGLCPGPLVLAWWREEGGQAVSLGSDAHDPTKLAQGFSLARDLLETHGFQSPAEPNAFWIRDHALTIIPAVGGQS